MKTVRFTEVVRRSGKPHVHTLWLAPEKDPALVRARKADRVMTVAAGGGAGKTDAGFVGFEPGQHEGGQFLIFPQSLKPFAGARVVGIKFDLIDQPKLVVATPEKKRAVPPKPKEKEKPPLKIEPETYPELQRELQHIIAELKAGRADAARRRLQRTIEQL
ncbi:MAG TPA: hypothetical protein VM029_12085 [Opitutaceae bacterium]|nr:hypothetical protein [Opitutaceae bacterium]